MKDIRFICVQPDDQYYVWQVHAWIESLRKIGKSDKAVVLVYIPYYRDHNRNWKKVEDLYPEAEFYYYKDVDNISKLIELYIPSLRPYTLMKHFKKFPELKEKAIFYCDSDTLFTENFNVDQYIDDDVNYLSNTNSYINCDYFDSKEKDVLPDKLEEYKKRDVLEEATNLSGVNRKVAEHFREHSGGAQYLLKNIDSQFWEHVLNDVIKIKLYLGKINREFFASEDKGFQSWCADMWAVLWNLWARNAETKVVPEMDFAWATDQIEKIKNVGIYHNAGVTYTFMDEVPMFWKGMYINGKNPFEDPHMQVVQYHAESAKKCTHYYVMNLLELKEKYNVSY